MLDYYQGDFWNKISGKFETKYNKFHTRKCNWKDNLQNGCHFVSVNATPRKSDKQHILSELLHEKSFTRTPNALHHAIMLYIHATCIMAIIGQLWNNFIKTQLVRAGVVIMAHSLMVDAKMNISLFSLCSYVSAFWKKRKKDQMAKSWQKTRWYTILSWMTQFFRKQYLCQIQRGFVIRWSISTIYLL